MKLKKYITKKNLVFLKKHISLFKLFNQNIEINKINYFILQQNNSKEITIKIHRIFKILQKATINSKKQQKLYHLLLRFKKAWSKINKNFIFNTIFDQTDVLLWLAYVLNVILYQDFKKTKKLIYKLKTNNLYKKLAEIIKLNFEDQLLNYDKKIKFKTNLLTKIKNNKIYLIISHRIILACLKSKIFIKKIKKYKNKKISSIYLNKKVFKKIFSIAIIESMQLPTLIPITYTKKDNIIINNNFNYSFFYEESYLEALNYLNQQEIIINKDYFKYLINLTDTKILKLSKNKIDLKSLNIKTSKKKNILHIKINALIFICNIYIISKYINFKFYFKYKIDKRGRIYQENWPMNSLYNKMLSPLFIFNETIKTQSDIKPNIENIFWYNSYKINKNNILSIRDATNSIFQIASCLTLDIKMLKYSNIHNEKIRYSLYDYILEKYKLNINELLNLIYNYYNKINDIYIDKIKNLNRKFLKKCIMTWSYNESYHSSVKKIYSYIFLNKSKKWLFKDDLLNNKEMHKIYIYISKLIHKYIFNIFKKDFIWYIYLKKLFALIAKILSQRNKQIIISYKNNFTHWFKQHHYSKDFKKIYIETLNKKKKYIYLNIINETNLSIKDNKRSLAPNIIQYLDSIIVIQMLLECKKNNIPVITNHDCFYTTLNNDNNILNIYNNILNNLFIKNNFLNNLIQINIDNIDNKKENDKIMKILNKINKNRTKNYEKIKTIFQNEILYSISIENFNNENE